MSPQPPRPLRESDRLGTFRSGSPDLDSWLATRATRNERAGASRTFVSVDAQAGDVLGFYCLSAGSLAVSDAPGRLRRNMPDPIPVVLIGRLAVSANSAGRGLGASLLQDALVRGLAASRDIAARAFVVEAKDERAATFYERFGFTRLPDPSRRLLYLLMDHVGRAIAARPRDEG